MHTALSGLVRAVPQLMAGMAAAWLGVGDAAAQDPPARRFPVLELQVQGNTVLTPAAIEAAVTPFLGVGKTAADIEAAAQALERAYAEAGYRTVSVNIPQQSVERGVVVLEVAEARVGRLRVEGARYFLPSDIRRGAPSLAPGTVPRFDRVERDLAQLNQLPDRRITPEVAPGSAPGTVDVALKVEDKLPLHGSAELNNQQSQSTRALRTQYSVRYDNLWQRGDSLNLSYGVAPERPADSRVFAASYLHRITGTPVSLLGSFVRSDSDVATVGSTTVVGRGTTIGVRALATLPGSPGFFHSITAGADRKRLRESVILGERNDFPIEYYPFNVTYLAVLGGEQSETELGAGLTWSFRGLGSDEGAFNQRRAFASPSFAYLRADAAHTHRLENGMQLYGRVEGQAAQQPLVSAEQFSLGGVQSIRGYFEGETLSDYGIGFQGEVRSPSYAQRISPRVNELRVHGFLDAGTGGLQRPLPGQDRVFTLVAAGVGARMKVFDYVNGAVEGATLLTDGSGSRAGSVRTLFRLWGEF